MVGPLIRGPGGKGRGEGVVVRGQGEVGGGFVEVGEGFPLGVRGERLGVEAFGADDVGGVLEARSGASCEPGVGDADGEREHGDGATGVDVEHEGAPEEHGLANRAGVRKVAKSSVESWCGANRVGLVYGLRGSRYGLRTLRP